MHSRSPRADGVQRLLDPSYYSTQTVYHQQQPRVYVDRKGVMHDPDYRHFPVVSSYNSTSTATSDDDDERAGFYADPFSFQSRRRSTSLTPPSTSFYSSSACTTPPDESPFDDPLPSEKQRTSVRQAFRRRRDRRRASLDSNIPERTVVEQEEYSEYEEDEEDEPEDDVDANLDDQTPTCGQALKRQWQSITFSLSFHAFRARRRLRRVLSQ
ncbi:hypothetical protein CYLTODRAFT_419753 [Cylindrobasidium torrendii FP15055 ss-10]|uniref:Uncharacterized protein n=1 Tax=Cylindrobasidium torrendii FP15055 ss-10 TaxID=1314674 RepID=A0A0D7BLB2_9AGAR|nr:hypothetical protein CYLTODRAFT_419753 [Cylindrobasidium torrendii FP15055 ss-10]